VGDYLFNAGISAPFLCAAEFVIAIDSGLLSGNGIFAKRHQHPEWSFIAPAGHHRLPTTRIKSSKMALRAGKSNQKNAG